MKDDLSVKVEPPSELDHRFTDLNAFKHWFASAPWCTASVLDAMASQVCEKGFTEPLSRRQIAPGVVRPGADIREGLAFEGLCSRVRAVMRAIEREVAGKARHNIKIYAAEAVTPFAMQMRGIFAKFIGSEFSADPNLAREMFPIPLEDLCRLSFADNVFDIVSTNEVLEHVPDLDMALAEICRVLVPGGVHIGTHPFRFMAQDSQVRARMVDGKVEHLMEPEIHGDPFGNKGSLVFELPGWDIIGRCLKSGFAHAEMRLMMSAEYGYIAGGVGGVFVLYARK